MDGRESAGRIQEDIRKIAGRAQRAEGGAVRRLLQENYDENLTMRFDV